MLSMVSVRGNTAPAPSAPPAAAVLAREAPAVAVAARDALAAVCRVRLEAVPVWRRADVVAMARCWIMLVCEFKFVMQRP